MHVVNELKKAVNALKNQKTPILLLLGFLLLVVGGIFLVLENHIYQSVDSAGVLHESLFLPLGMLSIALGAIVSVASAIWLFMKRHISSLKRKG